jgi:hypothetical protein
MTTMALQMLEAADAAHIQHPGGTLMAHLKQVKALLDSWGARPALAAADLCHAFYGTDGFPTALLNLEHRADLVKAIGPEAEEMAYCYASCDRKANALATNVHRFGHAALGFGRPQRCWRSLRIQARSRRWAARTSGWRACALRQRR